MAPPQLENEAVLVSEKTPLTLNQREKELEKKTFACGWEIAVKSVAFLFVAMCLTGASMIVMGVYFKRGEPVTSSLSLSSLSPEFDLGLQGVNRAEGANPSKIWGQVEGPYPTNSWYLVRDGVCFTFGVATKFVLTPPIPNLLSELGLP